MTRNTLLWALWILATLVIAAVMATRLFVSGDRTVLLPGETTGVHHQFEVACGTCHAEDAFESPKKQEKALNKTCVTCHKEELNASNDSHPIKKFKDPRMAALWEKIDGRLCTSCHLEHQPETTTVAGAVSLPMDFCVACHSEGTRDVRVNRASHADIDDYTTCASAGCHNFHDNRALYEDFLVKHGNAPWLAEQPIHKFSVAARSREKPAPEAVELYLASIEAPEVKRDEEIDTKWAHSAHAVAEVDCGSCHAPKAKTPEDLVELWTDEVPIKTCNKCHRGEASSFAQGRHGMRNHPKIAKARKPEKQIKTYLGYKIEKDGAMAEILAYLNDPTPPKAMSTIEARVDLHPGVEKDLTCSTCHQTHDYNIQKAAVEGCLTCHADDHSQAYRSSKHYELWQSELAGDLPAGSGVTCATCHMPKVEDPETGKTFVMHNQNTYLRPNEKMIRPVCMDCHGLSFAIDALADPALVSSNFQGQPTAHIESVDWALRRVDAEDAGANQ
ncbi:MAG: cytochrome c3 family protein [Mangrovicoccus sp.]